MHLGIATDHGGFRLKEDLVAQLRAVASGKLERGVAVCGSGVGASIGANKVPGVHAALILDHPSARQSRTIT
jgi:ribose 5-phosphate isomerase B